MNKATEISVKPPVNAQVEFRQLPEGTFFEYTQGANNPIRAMKLVSGKWVSMGGTLIEDWDGGASKRTITRVFEKVTLE